MDGLIWDKVHEECGVFGIFLRPGEGAEPLGVLESAYHALYALQHRGQESCGIAVCREGMIHCHKDVGLVSEVFTKEALEKLPEGSMALGHCRYATTGARSRDNAQPLLVNHLKGPMALCHNGNLANGAQLREELEREGAIFHTTSDSEVIAYLITQERLRADSLEEAVLRTMERLRGAYSLVLMSPGKLIAARDPKGFRPLCLGEREGATVVASESCALDAVGAAFVRDIEPGEVAVVTREGGRSLQAPPQGDSALCVFEFIYFARPDSQIDGGSVHGARLRAGAFLALDHPAQADVVIGVPDSGIDAAMGYAQQSGIPYAMGFIKNRYIGRTFIQPTQRQRDGSVRIKLNVVASAVRGKRVVLVDDSIVRGTTSERIVNLLREAGAKEVHMRLSSPPFTHPCYFGTDIDSTEHLIAARRSVGEIARIIGVDSLGFLGLERLDHLAQGCGRGFCKGCFTGEYPVAPPAKAEDGQGDGPLSRAREGA